MPKQIQGWYLWIRSLQVDGAGSSGELVTSLLRSLQSEGLAALHVRYQWVWY